MPTNSSVHNIGPAQRRVRRVMGIGALVAAFAFAAAASAADADVPIRLLSTPLVFLGFVGLFQSRDRTCVALAARGQCDLGAGLEDVEDPAQRRALRSQARSVLFKATGATVLATAVVLLLP